MALTKIDDRGLKTPIDLLDNEKIRLGTGNDLELFHDGTYSRINSENHGLIIRTDVFHINNGANNESLFRATTNNAVELYYDNSKKLETTSEGIKVTTDIQIEGDSGDTELKLKRTNTAGSNGNAFGSIKFLDENNNDISRISTIRSTAADDGDIKFETRPTGGSLTERLRITSSGVGIGTTSPSNKLEIQNTTSDKGILLKSTGNNYHTICGDANRSQATDNILRLDAKWNGNVVGRIRMLAGLDTTNKDDGIICFDTDSGSGLSERLRIDQTGNIRLPFVDGSTGLRQKIQFVTESPHFDEVGYIALNRTAVSSAPSDMVFATGTAGSTSERMRIVNDGRVRIVCESFASDPSSSNKGVMLGSTNTGSVFSSGSATNTQTHIIFRNGNGDVGTIQTSGSSTAYNTSSDYRLKENAVAISDGITRLKTLKPYRFNFKADADTTVDGFFAHEVTAVPEAISGTKDETKDILYTEEDTIPSGKKVGDVKETVPAYQGIDQSKIVPLLTAALQEAITKIETLETKVAALETA